MGLLFQTPRAGRAGSSAGRARRPGPARSAAAPSWSPAPARGSARPRPRRWPPAAPPSCSSPARRGARAGPRRDRGRGRPAAAYVCDLTDTADGGAVDLLVKPVLDEHGAVDYLVNNAGRSIRRSLHLSYDRFHDVERSDGGQLPRAGAAHPRPAAGDARPAVRPRGQHRDLGRADEGAEVQRLHRVQDRARRVEPDRRPRDVRRQRHLHQHALRPGAYADERADRAYTQAARARLPSRPRPGGPRAGGPAADDRDGARPAGGVVQPGRAAAQRRGVPPHRPAGARLRGPPAASRPTPRDPPLDRAGAARPGPRRGLLRVLGRADRHLRRAAGLPRGARGGPGEGRAPTSPCSPAAGWCTAGRSRCVANEFRFLAGSIGLAAARRITTRRTPRDRRGAARCWPPRPAAAPGCRRARRRSCRWSRSRGR